MEVLVVDIGGFRVKVAMRGTTVHRIPTPPLMTPRQLMQAIATATGNWNYDHVSIGFPGPVRDNRPVREPVNLGGGWVEFDFSAAFGCPVRMINDAAMQALGSYHGGVMLFLGLGTGLGTTLIHDGHLVPMEISHLPFREGETFESALGKAGLERLGEACWKQYVLEAIKLYGYALYPDYIVLGGGNVARFNDRELPRIVERGDNENAIRGGLRLWEADVATGHPATNT